MNRNENRWNALAMGALLVLFAVLVFFLNGCSWDFAHDAHGTHSVEHHGDFHHGEACAVCAGQRPVANAATVCAHGGQTARP